MAKLTHLLENNKTWVKRVENEQPDFFENLSKQQAPEYLWIGCSDSRVPANQITGLMPGEVFVHRNIANVVKPNDPNCQAVIQFAVQVLQVKHIIVCGHYGCGGVMAATLDNAPEGHVKEWLNDLQPVVKKHETELNQIQDIDKRVDRCCELNVTSQVVHVGESKAVQEAWSQGRELHVHGWIYSVKNGLLKDLKVTLDSVASHLALKKIIP